MNKNLILIILIFSILSLIIIFPRFYEEEKKEEVDLQILNYAKNLCIALCEHIKENFTVESVCLSDKDTITGIYWNFEKISCFINGESNPCIERGDIEIILHTNCSVKDIKYTTK